MCRPAQWRQWRRAYWHGRHFSGKQESNDELELHLLRWSSLTARMTWREALMDKGQGTGDKRNGMQ